MCNHSLRPLSAYALLLKGELREVKGLSLKSLNFQQYFKT
ncbi:hypothetical protein BAOM_1936 [Peribacillus asahii]|uniref:Uncharacterized protein n=1 Tax=Peribacillus asahii TaxID=228899 RepID=A0A3Q9RLV5_9BACI|nr:hypothetical protein BAOM_1936 [Peribacillus asahii]